MAIVERLESIEDPDELEFLELVSRLKEYPFSEEVALEILLSIASFIGKVQAHHEAELEKAGRLRKELGTSCPPEN